MARLVVILVVMVACGSPAAKPTTPESTAARRVVVLPADNAVYPAAAESATRSLGRTRVRGFDAPEMSKVSLEVAQLSLECVDPTAACYAAVGKSLAANQILFAQFEPGPEPEQVRVIVTLFDVDALDLKKRARKVFATELDAAYGIREVVEAATRP